MTHVKAAVLGENQQAAANGETKTWPLAATLLTAWLFPRTTALRTLHAPPWKVWLVHIVAVLAGVLTVCSLTALDEVIALGERWISLGTALLQMMRMAHEFEKDPITCVLIVVSLAATIEGVHFGVAFMVTAWGAVDEPLKNSFGYALRQVWLHTAHAVVVVLALGPMIVISEYLLAHNSPKWYLKYGEFIYVPTGIGLLFWFIWALLRAVGAPRPPSSPVRPPTCEWCGYNLTTMTLKNRCPECGRGAVESIGPLARPGAPWVRSEIGGVLRRWLVTWTMALLSPVRFSYLLRLRGESAHRRFMMGHLPLIFIVAASALIGFAWLQHPGGARGANPPKEVYTIAAPIFGTGCTVAATAVTLLTASVFGFDVSSREKRNLLPIAMQAAAYLAPFLLLWEIFGALAALWAFLLAESDWLWSLYHRSGRMDPAFIAWMAWLIPNLGPGVWYLLTVRRITRAARYANH